MKNTLNTPRKPNRIKKCVSLLTVMLSLVLLLGGCIPNNFTPEEEHAFLETASEVVSNFLDKQYSGAKIAHIQAETDVAPDGSGYELTEFASGQFSRQGQTYHFLVNTETEEVYTSVYLPINDRSTGRDLDIRAVRNVFPLRDSAEELLEEILQDTENYTVFIEIQYKGEGLPAGITEQDAPFPALLSATDKKEAEKYCYAFDREAHKKVEIEEGMWFAYEDRYVYADNIYLLMAYTDFLFP